MCFPPLVSVESSSRNIFIWGKSYINKIDEQSVFALVFGYYLYLWAGSGKHLKACQGSITEKNWWLKKRQLSCTSALSGGQGATSRKLLLILPVLTDIWADRPLTSSCALGLHHGCTFSVWGFLCSCTLDVELWPSPSSRQLNGSLQWCWLWSKSGRM